MTAYLETSALMKLVATETESAAVEAYLSAAAKRNDALTSSWLSHTELHRAARRRSDLLDEQAVQVVLDALDLVDVTTEDFRSAALLPGRLRSHDAIHLAVALRIEADSVITYDAEFQQAARAAGLAVVAPA